MVVVCRRVSTRWGRMRWWDRGRGGRDPLYVGWDWMYVRGSMPLKQLWLFRIFLIYNIVHRNSKFVAKIKTHPRASQDTESEEPHHHHHGFSQLKTSILSTMQYYKFIQPFGSYVETCTSFYIFSGPKKLSGWVCYWTPTQPHHRWSTSHCWTPSPPCH
jgi:hypothetical protein